MKRSVMNLQRRIQTSWLAGAANGRLTAQKAMLRLLVTLLGSVLLILGSNALAQLDSISTNSSAVTALRVNAADTAAYQQQMICKRNQEYYFINAPSSSDEESIANASVFYAKKINESRSSIGSLKVLTKNKLLHSQVIFSTAKSNIVLDCTLAYVGELKLKPQSPRITGIFSNGDRLAFIDSGGAFVGTIGCSYHEWCGQPILFLARSSDTSISWERAVAHNAHTANLNIQRTTGDINWVILKDDSVVGFTNDGILIVFNGNGQLIKKILKTKYIAQRNPALLEKQLDQSGLPLSCRENLDFSEALKKSACRAKRSKFLKNLFSK
jgi:hypothetical protein